MAGKLGRCLCTYARSINLRTSIQSKVTCQAWKSSPALLPAAINLQPKRWSSDALDFNEPSEGHRYAKSHEWASLDGKIATVGISNYAQEELGDAVFVDLPDVGTELQANDTMGVIESVKAAADVNTPMSGTVVEVNGALEDNPELVNKEPYGNGWIIKLEASDASEYEELMSVDEYEEFLKDSEV